MENFLKFWSNYRLLKISKKLILPLLVLISLFGYIHTKRGEPSNKKAGAILSGSQNTIFILSIFLATYFEPWEKKRGNFC
jgi:hypothetical protein